MPAEACSIPLSFLPASVLGRLTRRLPQVRARLVLRPVRTLARILARGVALVFAFAAACSPAPAGARAPEVITVSAAASLSEVLAEVIEAFEPARPGISVQLNLGSSGALQRQIELGAPVDVFLSAAAGPVQALVDKGLVPADQVWVFATNRVVLVASQNTSPGLQSWKDLLRSDVRRIAVGNPEHGPAGQYGRAVLESLGLWGPIEGKLVFGEDVRQVLAYVASGEVDAAIVYSTDVTAGSWAGRAPAVVGPAAGAPAGRIRLVAEAPGESHEPVVYLAAILRDSRAPTPARSFVDFLVSAEGQAILNRYGFGGARD